MTGGGGGDDGHQTAAGLVAYWKCLKENRAYRMLWFAELVDNVGSWLNYVATLQLVESFSGGSGLAISAVVLIRFLPSLVLCPAAGVIADRCNRIKVIAICALVDAVLVACLVLITTPSRVGLLYALLCGQFAAVALQEPAKKALIPVLVPKEDLHLASTLDTFAWSITGAVGASTGGLAASHLGNATCFLLDAVTYLIAAWCAWRIPLALGRPDAMVHQRRSTALKKRTSDVHDIELAAASFHVHVDSHSSDDGDELQVEVAPLLHQGELEGGISGPGLIHHHHHQGGQGNKSGETAGAHVAGDLQHHTSPSINSNTPISTSSKGLVADSVAAILDGVKAMNEGFRFITHPVNRDVAALVLIKGCGSLTWGAADVLNVAFANMPSMHPVSWMDSPTTLGIIFAFVGLGCFAGPVVMNAFVPPQPLPLLWACVASFGMLFAGFSLMTVAENIYIVLFSTFVRAIGSACLWVYSTLLLQLRVPNNILGRTAAVEMAIFTIAEAVSSVYGGAAYDVLGLNLHQTVLVLSIIAGGVTAAWFAYAHRLGKANKLSGSAGASTDI